VDQLLAVDTGHFPMVEGILVLVELALDSAELEVTFAEVSEFEYFLGNTQLLGSLHFR